MAKTPKPYSYQHGAGEIRGESTYFSSKASETKGPPFLDVSPADALCAADTTATITRAVDDVMVHISHDGSLGFWLFL